MEFIKILFNIAFTVLPLLLLLLLQQIPAASTTTQRSTTENKFQNAETTTIATKISQTTKTTATPATTTTTTTTANNKNKNNITATTTTTTRALRKQEQIIDNSIDFAVDPCDDFYQYACGEWKQQLYEYNDEDADAEDKSAERVFGTNKAEQSVNDDADAESDKYDRTLAMIDYLADKEVLRYFNVRNMTKNLNTTTTTTTSTSTTGSQTTITKEPDFIIKVYKYYKSCIAIQQYEPIKYLEWLELNEHVKWPSLINTTTANSKEHDVHKHDHAAVAEAEAAGEDIDEIIMDDDHDDDDVDDEAEESESGDDNNDEAAQDYDSSWITMLAILRKYGMNGIFIEEVIYNTKSLPSKMLLGFNKPIKQGGFKSLKSDHLKIVLNNLKLEFSEESFKKLWLQVTKFEWELTKLNDLGDELGTVIIPISHLPMSWLSDYLRVILQQNKPLDSSMRIVLTNAAYFMALNELLNEYDNNFLNQYLQIRFLWHLYQQEPQTFQPLDCILHIKHYMPLAFEWIFEQQNQQQLYEEIPKIHDLYSNLRRQFNLTLYTNKNNFDSATLDHFVKKLESIQLNVGSFVDIDRSKFFYENRKFYSQLILSSSEFFSNHLKMLKFNFNALHFGMRNVNTYSHYYDMQEYNRGLTSAPHFNKRLNIVHIPLSLLQPPLYHKDFTDIYKYSTMGFILAQTLMYSFNLNGLAAAEHPKLFKHFKCLGSWDSPEVNDKIADVSGFRLAYHSFFQSHANALVSNRKKFFLNFAQSFCASRSSDDDLGRSHVNYALAQFSEFAKTFECSPDSHMNPHEKCYLWD